MRSMPRKTTTLGWLLLGIVFPLADMTAAGRPPASTDFYGDPLPDGAQARIGSIRWQQTSYLVYLGAEPGGNTLIAVGQDGACSRMDANTGKELRRFGEAVDVTCAALSANGRILALAGLDETIRLWNVSEGKVVQQLAVGGVVVAVAFTGDGKTLVSRERAGAVRMWNTTTGKELRHLLLPRNQSRYTVEAANSLALSPDGRTLAYASPGLVNLLDVRDGKDWRSISTGEPERLVVTAVAFTPDSKSLAWAAHDSTVRLTNLETDREVRRLGVPQPRGFIPAGLLLSPDGKMLASSHYDRLREKSRQLRLWDISTGKEIHQLSEPVDIQGLAAGGAFTQGGKVLSVAAGRCGTRIRSWEVAGGRERQQGGGHRQAVTAAVLSPDGQILTTLGDDRIVRRWEARTGKELHQFALRPEAVSPVLAPDGQAVAHVAGDGTIRVLASATGKELRRFAVEEVPREAGALLYAPDGLALAVRGHDDAIRLYDAGNGRLLRRFTPRVWQEKSRETPVKGMAFSPDGTLLAGAQEATVFLWDTASGRELRRFTLGGPFGGVFAFSPDGHVLAVGHRHRNYVVSLWETLTGQRRGEIWTPDFRESITAVSFSKDGRTLAGACAQAEIRLWDVETLKPLAPVRGHRDDVRMVEYAADGQTLISGSNDTTALLWKAAGLNTLPRHPPFDLQPAVVDALWEDLVKTNAYVAHSAMRALRAAPKAALPFLKERLRPVPVDEQQRIARLVVDLDSNRFAARQKAAMELEKLGAAAQPELLRALAGKPSLELRRRVDQLLDKVPHLKGPSPDLQALRALEVLEAIGTAEARQLLEEIATGAPNAPRTREARAALQRMAKRQ
jgi:WD40 repeat protein